MSVAERKEREKEQRRIDIIDAAEKLFFSSKFDDVSMDDIAKAVELSRATLYLYFADKESLFFAVLLRGVRIMRDMFKESVVGKATGIDMISAIGAAFIKFNTEYPDYHRLLQYSSSQRFEKYDNEYVCESNSASTEIIRIMCTSIKKGMEDGTIKSDVKPLETALFLKNGTENALNMSPAMRKKLEILGISHEDYLNHCMKLMGYAIANENNSKV